MAGFRFNRNVWALFALLNVLLLALIVLLLQYRAGLADLETLEQLGAAVYPQPMTLDTVELTDQHGDPFNLDNLHGSWNLVFFGFSNCPDVCPLTLAQLEDFYRSRPEPPQAPVQVVFVSVDPADTPATIGDYLAGFHTDFIGLSGSEEAVAGFAGQLFVNTGGGRANTSNAMSHGHQAADAPQDIISHSIHIGVVNPAGELVGLLRPPHRAPAISEALGLILRRA